MGCPWLVWSLVLNYHTVLSGIFISRKQVTTTSCLPMGRETQNEPLGHPTGEMRVDLTPSASEKSVCAGWSGVWLRGP